MKKRNLSILIAIIILIGSLMLSMFLGSQNAPMKKNDAPRNAKKPVRAVMVHNSNQIVDIPVTGKVAALDHFDIFAEVGGMILISQKPFKEGVHFHKDDILVQIDDQEFQLNLLAQKITFLNTVTQLLPDLKLDFPESLKDWEDYLKALQLDQPLPELPQPVSEKEKYFLAMRNIYNAYYSIKSAEVRLGKYTIRAPYTGVLTNVNVTPGTIVSAGQGLGSYMSTEAFEFEAAVSLEDLMLLSEGNAVRLQSGDIPGTWQGKITRISEHLDPATQTVKIFVRVSTKHLKDGMYLNGFISSDTLHNVFNINRDLLVGDDKVYAIEQDRLVLKPVTVIKSLDDRLLISGLPDGTALLDEVIVGVKENMEVSIINNGLNK